MVDEKAAVCTLLWAYEKQREIVSISISTFTKALHTHECDREHADATGRPTAGSSKWAWL
jgi:hypothetical protein